MKKNLYIHLWPLPKNWGFLTLLFLNIFLCSCISWHSYVKTVFIIFFLSYLLSGALSFLILSVFFILDFIRTICLCLILSCSSEDWFQDLAPNPCHYSGRSSYHPGFGSWETPDDSSLSDTVLWVHLWRSPCFMVHQGMPHSPPPCTRADLKPPTPLLGWPQGIVFGM